MGLVTGKVLSYATRCKSCRVCDSSKRSGKAAKNHDYRKNHAGSSKSMERDVACELSRSTPIAGVKFSTYVRDDDSTTLADIHAKVPYDVQKWSDTVHTKTEISNKSLIQSQRTHPSIKTLFKLFCIKSKGDQLFCEMFQLCYNSKCRKFRCFKSKS